MKRLAGYLGISEEQFEELNIELMADSGSSGEMVYSYYFTVPEDTPEEILEATGWQVGETVNGIPTWIVGDDDNDTQEVDDEERAWILSNPQEARFEEFISDLQSIRRHSSKGFLTTQLDLRMVHSYAVTLFEAFLSETAKYLIAVNANARQKAANFFSNVPIPEKFTLAQAMHMNVTNVILSRVGGLTFHNTKTATKFFSEILEGAPLDFSKLKVIVDTRHDIVHRNGRRLNGSNIFLSPESVDESLTKIEEVVRALQKQVLIKEGL